MINLHSRLMETKSSKDGGYAWIILAGETDKKYKANNRTYHPICNKINTKGATSGAVTACFPPESTTVC